MTYFCYPFKNYNLSWYVLVLLYFSLATRPDILSVLEADPQLSSLTLSNKALQDVHVLPLYRALQCHDILTKLMLPGNRIGKQAC